MEKSGEEGFERLPRDEKIALLKQAKEKLSPGENFRVRCRNRRHAEIQGDSEAYKFLYFNEFVELFCREFADVSFEGQRPEAPEPSARMSEIDEFFFATATNAPIRRP